MTIKLHASVPTTHDYGWSLKSTEVDRGDVLMRLATEWSGEGSEVEPDRAAAHAAEQVFNLLVWLTEHVGPEAAAAAMALAGERVAETAVEWEDQGLASLAAMLGMP